MAAVVGKYAAKKMLGKQMEKYKTKDVGGDTDPYFTYITNPRTGKMKKVKKQVPDYIPEHDAVILAKMRQRSYALDMSLFNLFGVRFGWSSVLGLLPGAGDALDGVIAYLLYRRCCEVSCGLGSDIDRRMKLNIIIDFFIGLVPFLGDFVDAYFKANTRNVRLLEQRLDDIYNPERKIKQRKKDELPATVYEDFSDEEQERRRFVDGTDDVRRPDPARYPEDRRGENVGANRGFGGFFGGGGRRERQPDIERAPVQPSRPEQGSYRESDRRKDGGRF